LAIESFAVASLATANFALADFADGAGFLLLALLASLGFEAAAPISDFFFMTISTYPFRAKPAQS
jgi:hypothetical protein